MMNLPKKNLNKNSINYKLIKKSLVVDLLSGKTSLENNPGVPSEYEGGKFLQNLFLDRYKKLYIECNRVNNTQELNVIDVARNSSMILQKIMRIEAPHREQLTKLALNIVREAFEIDEDDVTFEAKISSDPIDMGEAQEKPVDENDPSIEFNSYEEVLQAKDEVKKRRLINALIQGSANSFNSIYHMYRDELNAIDHRLYTLYQILIPNAEISYYFHEVSKSTSTAGGKCEVKYPKTEKDDKDNEDSNNENNKTESTRVIASALAFPILIQELVKGVMEIISHNGLPEDQHLTSIVLDRSDYYGAEGWDMLLGIPLWQNLVSLVDLNDYGLKHQIFYDLVMLETEDFNKVIPEILGKTLKGKEIMDDIVKNIKHELKMDNISSTLYDLDEGDDDFIDLKDIDTKF